MNMGILSVLFHSRDKPTNATSGSSYRFFLGGSTSGKAVTERSAMQMTAVYSCVRILAEAIAGLPLHLYTYKEDGELDLDADQQDEEVNAVFAFDGEGYLVCTESTDPAIMGIKFELDPESYGMWAWVF